MATLNKTDKRIQQLAKARAAAQAFANTHPYAVNAYFDVDEGKIIVEFNDGTEFRFPPCVAQGLGSATPEELIEVQITPSGLGLHWESLDADLLIPELMKGIYGTQQWMAEMGAKGGRAKSSAKAAAARKNGTKGGRPRKQV